MNVLQITTFQNNTNGPVRGSDDERVSQDILEPSILAALPSDKHMAGVEPRGRGNTTDAIQSTSFLLNEPGEQTSKKERTSREETQTVTFFHIAL